MGRHDPRGQQRGTAGAQHRRPGRDEHRGPGPQPCPAPSRASIDRVEELIADGDDAAGCVLFDQHCRFAFAVTRHVADRRHRTVLEHPDREPTAVLAGGDSGPTPTAGCAHLWGNVDQHARSTSMCPTMIVPSAPPSQHSEMRNRIARCRMCRCSDVGRGRASAAVPGTTRAGGVPRW